jgi:Heterokaryon incompatibility protein (HET)
MASPSIYRPLDKATREIRLLTILPGDNNSTLACSLKYVSLNDHPRYAALSYTWGDPSITQEILVNGQTFAATVNLVAALHHVPQLWRDKFPEDSTTQFIIWVDAVCIDQSNEVERGHQVMLMETLYSEAESVLAWLGLGDDSALAMYQDEKADVSLALDTLELVASETTGLGDEEILKLDWIKKHPSLYKNDIPSNIVCKSDQRNHRWAAVIRTLQLSYWYRIWTLQEMVLAQNLLFCTPGRCVEYKKVEKARKSLKVFAVTSEQLNLRLPSFLDGCVAIKLLQSVQNNMFQKLDIVSYCKECFNFFAEEMELIASGHPWTKTMVMAEATGWAIFEFGRQFKATNPKDLIYGLLAITRINLVPDYDVTTTVGQVYSDFIRLSLEFYKNHPSVKQHELEFLGYAGIGLFENALHLPSWVPNYPEISNDACNPTVILGNADLGIFASSTDQAVVARDRLLVSGLQCDQIKEIYCAISSNTLDDGSMYEFVANFVSQNTHYKDTSIPPLQAILRTILSNKWPHTVNEDITICAVRLLRLMLVSSNLVQNSLKNNTARLKAWELTFASLGIDIWDFNQSFIQIIFPGYAGKQLDWFYYLDSHSEDDPRLRQLDFDTMFALDALDGNRAFFKTEGGYLGYCPIRTAPGDQVYVLCGSSSPVILRQVEEYYVNVGTCYVAGLMNGEASVFLELDGRKVERLCLC